MKVAVVILAAGAGTRMGGPKALLRIGPDTFLARLAARFERPGVARVIAVVGHEAGRVGRDSGAPPATVFALNERHREGMLTSIWTGLDEAESAGADAVLLHPVDHPLVEDATIDRVLAALEGGAVIAVPSHESRRGHPGGFARAAWPALRAAPPEMGARAVLAAHPDWITHVPGDPGCLAGIDTPADYERLLGHRDAWSLAREIEDVARQVEHSFPYEDCRRILREAANEAYDMLVPDLDLHKSTIQGWATGARRLLGAGGAQLLDGLRRDTRASFFERHPLYEPLRSTIQSGSAPSLQRDLEHSERLRLMLLELAALLAPQP